MAEKIDYYEVLGVERTAGDGEIKSAYRRLALKFHPDRNQGDPQAEESFKQASEAYSVLADAQKRAAYDRFGHAGVNGGAGAGGFDPSQFTDFSDIFGDFFGLGEIFGAGGARRDRRSGQRGSDLRYDLTISFEESLHGVEREISFQRLVTCEACKGRRTRGGVAPAVCPNCGGRGQVRFQQGFFSVARTCGSCGGAGAVIRDPCPECRAQGRVSRSARHKVTIPAGVEDGMQLRLNGQGESGLGDGSPGDLYVLVNVKPHEFYQRKGNDLYCSVRISFPQAVLGCDIQVQTPWGPEITSVPAGTSSGDRLHPMRGKGAPKIDGRGKGDLHVMAVIDVPRKVSKEQRQALQDLARLMPNENALHDTGLFEKVKDLFG